MRLKYFVIFLLFFSFACSDQVTKNEEMLSNSLVANYLFNGNCNDISKYKNNGIAIGSTLTIDRHGDSNSAYYFDGIDDKIIFPFSEETNFDASSDDYSISLWVRGDSDNFSDCRIFQKWNNILDTPYMISIQAGYNKCHAIIYDTDSLNIMHFGNIWDNNWHHLTVVVDNSNKKFSIFLDGDLKDHTNITLKSSTKTEQIFSAGGIENSCRDRSMRGVIDDIKIYNKALSANEVKVLSYE